MQPDSGEPLYRQLIRQVEHAIVTGLVAPGEKLPTVRELARELVINPNTVARAYRELEGRDLVRTRVGNGTFVADQPPELSLERRRSRIRPLAQRLVTEARLLRLPSEEVLDEVRRALRETDGDREEGAA